MNDIGSPLINSIQIQIGELESRLCSHRSLTDEEKDIHRQFDDLLQLHYHLQDLEKSISELLKQRDRFPDEQIIRISEQLVHRTKQIAQEIEQRFELLKFSLKIISMNFV